MSDEIWHEDRLNREADAKFLIRFLINRIEERARSGRTRSYVLNVNASWGTGKTFFLERLQRQLESEQYPVAYVNAWADDHAADPLLSVMSAIDEAIQPLIVHDEEQVERWRKVKATASIVAVSIAKGAIKHWARKAIGEGADAIGEAVFGNDQSSDGRSQPVMADSINAELNSAIDDYSNKLLSGFRRNREMIDRFRSGLKEFIEKVDTGSLHAPLFVLIDELDRCRPLYAIELLERIKHIFETDNVVFIIATDTDQLGHSVKAIYGSDFDAERYLMRFFDRSYEFEEPSVEEYVIELCARYRINEEDSYSLPRGVDVATYLAGCFHFLGLTLRDVDQCLDIIRIIETTWIWPDLKIQICLLAPLVAIYQQKRSIKGVEIIKIELKKILETRSSTGNTWLFNKEGAAPFDGSAAFQGLLVGSVKTLSASSELENNSFRSPSNNLTTSWVTRQFQDELISLHSVDGKLIREDAFSITRQYPDFIRSAGRLVGPAFDKDGAKPRN
ncbi:KAP family P-loop NTPase fold protein [Martelella limonii]|uniref:KAP family P-loop NTPase fold protein n=1 Tax=Martelella limonii TaxID=1647649 RepID=UPI00158009FC|nr:P-loop NTPase fold protein [Martelella limonii]